MSELDENLKVVTDHLQELSQRQQTAADKITGANRATTDIAARVEISHGLICFATSHAMSAGEDARKAAGETLFNVSTDFTAKLDTAAINYSNEDYRAGRSIGENFNA